MTHTRTILTILLAAMLPMPMRPLAGQGDAASVRPSFVAPREFAGRPLRSPKTFLPAYFWCWNGPLKPDVLRRQLADMAAHDARSVCVLPMPHEFRPENTNKPRWTSTISRPVLQRVKIAVDEAARLGMNYWLYDEGGWPSGQRAGACWRQPGH